MIVEYHPAVRRELETIRGYHEERVPTLALDFLAEQGIKFSVIAAAPYELSFGGR